MRHASFQAADFGALDPAARFLLWIMRAWVQGCKSRTLPAVPVEKACAAIGLPEAAVALDAALRGVAEATRRPLRVHCPHCPELSEDEQRLLAVAAAVQHHDAETARDLLSDIVVPCRVGPIIGSLARLGLMLAVVGLELPRLAGTGRSGSAPRTEPAPLPTTLH